MSGLKFKNGLDVDECTECWGRGGFWVSDLDPYDKEFETCKLCGGTGYDSNDYYQYMMEQEEEEENMEPVKED